MPRRPSLARLQKRGVALLGLGDWDIKMRYCAQDELKKDSDGENRANHEHRIADILIIDPDLRDSTDDIRPFSVHETVLHELLHCLIVMPNKLQEERAIISIARALEPLL